jgi:hypothetical protein
MVCIFLLLFVLHLNLVYIVNLNKKIKRFDFERLSLRKIVNPCFTAISVLQSTVLVSFISRQPLQLVVHLLFLI